MRNTPQSPEPICIQAMQNIKGREVGSEVDLRAFSAAQHWKDGFTEREWDESGEWGP